jgi:hypothetical protein
MSTFDPIAFARRSAKAAYDQRAEYDDSAASFRENLIDTLADEGTDAATTREALDVYDAEVQALMPVTVVGVVRTSNPLDGTQHHVRLSNGASFGIQRMSAVETMGLGGWHVIYARTPDGEPIAIDYRFTYLADTKADALNELCRRASQG